jgi:hypothetical protein
MTMIARARTLVAVAGTAILLPLISPTLAQAAWGVSIQPGSQGQAASQAAPVAPTGVTAACVGLLSGQITVSWTSVTHADSYTIYISSAASTGPFTVAGSSATSPWTSPVLGTGGFWFAVAADIGATWISPRSGPSGGHTILISLACI